MRMYKATASCSFLFQICNVPSRSTKKWFWSKAHNSSHSKEANARSRTHPRPTFTHNSSLQSALRPPITTYKGGRQSGIQIHVAAFQSHAPSLEMVSMSCCPPHNHVINLKSPFVSRVMYALTSIVYGQAKEEEKKPPTYDNLSM
jgi:hypothetical protein